MPQRVRPAETHRAPSVCSHRFGTSRESPICGPLGWVRQCGFPRGIPNGGTPWEVHRCCSQRGSTRGFFRGTPRGFPQVGPKLGTPWGQPMGSYKGFNSVVPLGGSWEWLARANPQMSSYKGVPQRCPERVFCTGHPRWFAKDFQQGYPARNYQQVVPAGVPCNGFPQCGFRNGLPQGRSRSSVQPSGFPARCFEEGIPAREILQGWSRQGVSPTGFPRRGSDCFPARMFPKGVPAKSFPQRVSRKRVPAKGFPQCFTRKGLPAKGLTQGGYYIGFAQGVARNWVPARRS